MSDATRLNQSSKQRTIPRGHSRTLRLAATPKQPMRADDAAAQQHAVARLLAALLQHALADGILYVDADGVLRPNPIPRGSP